MEKRIYNFSAGPATLPLEVLKQAKQDIVNFNACGIGVMELSHRSSEFIAICESCKNNLREILNIPENFDILFLQGGASSQFFMIPMNLLRKKDKATYLNTGLWSKKAIQEARQFGEIEIGFSGENSEFSRIPQNEEITVAEESQYLYYTSNNTIYGTQFQIPPQPIAENEMMLICDMSSDILSRSISFKEHGIIFAGAQKNLGISGVTLIIIRKDLLQRAPEDIPTMLKFRTHAEKNSMFNTPPTFSIYILGEMLKWLQREGGIKVLQQRNKEKAKILYDCIDNMSYYRGHAQKDSRSIMNIPFNLPSKELEKKFLLESRENGMSALKGHASIGGCRASLYNAFPISGVKKLTNFMEQFALKNPV